MPAGNAALIEAAARPYLAATPFAYYFARAKLTHDPVFIALLRSGRFPDGARVLDLGCNLALLASLMLAARERFDSGLWPHEWATPPAQLHWHGIEWNDRAARRANIALAPKAVIHTLDLRKATLPAADVILLIDVLHYLDPAAQLALLEKTARSLNGGGLLILRVADTEAGWRFHLGSMGDRFGLPLNTRICASRFYRPVREWVRLLTSLGFSAGREASGAGESLANKLIWAQAASGAKR